MSETIVQATPLKQYGISGPASALDNEVPVFDGTTGKKQKAGSGILITAGSAGSAQGQLGYWDHSLKSWIHTETNELVWDDVSKRLGIGAAVLSSKLSLSEKLRLFDTKPINAPVSTDAGYLFGSAIPSGFITEISGEVLSYAINVPQVGTRDTARVGGIFRLDTRAAHQYFIIYSYPTGGSVATERFSINLQDGRTRIQNVDAGGRALFEVRGNSAYFDMRAHGTSWSETLFGNSVADTSMIMGRHGKILIGTYENDDLILGTNNNERIRIKNDGGVGVGTVPTAMLDIGSDIIRLRNSKTPASAGAAGNQGDECWDANFHYRCVATNTWKRSALNAW